MSDQTQHMTFVERYRMQPDIAEKLVKLWALLDDIDTLDDAAKGDDVCFRRAAYRVQQKRHQILHGDDWNKLRLALKAIGRSAP